MLCANAFITANALVYVYDKERRRGREEGDILSAYTHRPILPCLNKGEGGLLYLDDYITFCLSCNIIWVPFIRYLT